MWKCMECGFSSFFQYVKGYEDVVFDKNGDYEVCCQELETLEVECDFCGNSRKKINEIAYWEKKKKKKMF